MTDAEATCNASAASVGALDFLGALAFSLVWREHQYRLRLRRDGRRLVQTSKHFLLMRRAMRLAGPSLQRSILNQFGVIRRQAVLAFRGDARGCGRLPVGFDVSY